MKEINTTYEIIKELFKFPDTVGLLMPSIDWQKSKDTKWVKVDHIVQELYKLEQRLKGYGCGEHIQLEKQLTNLIKKLIKGD